jgi:hypothetical protein
MTAFSDIERKIRQRLVTNWNDTPIQFVNTPSPLIEPPFIYCEIMFAASEQTSIGQGVAARQFRHSGIIMITIYVARNIGSGEITSYADSLAAIFRSANIDGVVCSAPVLDRARPADAEGQYWMRTLTIPFYANAIL